MVLIPKDSSVCLNAERRQFKGLIAEYITFFASYTVARLINKTDCSFGCSTPCWLQPVNCA